MFGETLVPPYVQRLCIGKTAAEAARGTLLSGLFSIPFFAVTGLIGLVALAIDPALDSNLAMPHVVVTVMPPVLKGLRHRRGHLDRDVVGRFLSQLGVDRLHQRRAGAVAPRSRSARVSR